MTEEDQDFVSEHLDEEDTNTLLEKVTRIEKGVVEIYKLLQTIQVTPNTTHPELTDKMCNEHGEPMQKAISKKTNKPYSFHKNEAGQICFGRGYQS